ncbi:PPC domain-containing DNA-binding protein [Anthocerotibacter panamensis]|uniref:PPC domain-containing DNA-binding protein n=1 Tax=Anthocerotibacter panamensis TaxID=2857077 RepID=UPI001C401D77|nr:PPC domain-containing DNA-binding protein [Anthocerotibacter panamensis]
MDLFALRLEPGQDLKQSLQQFTQARGLLAGFILTAVGSLEQVALRLAGAHSPTIYTATFEIVSLVGTLCPTGLHLHLAVADHQGQTWGGHLLEGCIVYTTAEIVVGTSASFTFTRETDRATGYLELKVTPSCENL